MLNKSAHTVTHQAETNQTNSALKRENKYYYVDIVVSLTASVKYTEL